LCLNWWCLGHHRQRRLQLAVSRQPRSSGRPALEQHGVTLVLAEDGAGRTRLEEGRRHEGTLAVEKTERDTAFQTTARHDVARGCRGTARRRGGWCGGSSSTVGRLGEGETGGSRWSPEHWREARRWHRGATESRSTVLSDAQRGVLGLSSTPGCSTEQRRDRGQWAAPNADAEARRRWRNALGPASRQLGWGLAERRWSSRTGGLGRRARDGKGGAGGIGARRSAALATNE
jgi:hypothetical protein